MDDFHPMGLWHPSSLCQGMLSGPNTVCYGEKDVEEESTDIAEESVSIFGPASHLIFKVRHMNEKILTSQSVNVSTSQHVNVSTSPVNVFTHQHARSSTSEYVNVLICQPVNVLILELVNTLTPHCADGSIS